MSSNTSLQSQTLLSLEERLRRIHFLLLGDGLEQDEGTAAERSDSPMAVRLQRLERGMETLSANSSVVQSLFRLREHHVSSVVAG